MMRIIISLARIYGCVNSQDQDAALCGSRIADDQFCCCETLF